MPAARALSSPSGEAAEDNVEERENSEVTQFLVTGYVTDGQTDVRTYGRMDRETWQLKYYFRYHRLQFGMKRILEFVIESFF